MRTPRSKVSKTKFIISERLRPGDVILLDSDTARARLIKIGQNGPWYHPALVLNQFTVFESDGMGIGRTPLQQMGMARVGGKLVSLSRPSCNPTDFCVLRHPNLENIDAQKLDEALGAFVTKYAGLDYSDVSRLMEAAFLPKHVRRALASIVSAVADPMVRRFADRKIPGPFCSELIAAFFDGVGHSAFGDNRKPETVAPSHLADAAISVLEQRADAIVVDPIIEVEPNDIASGMSREEWLPVEKHVRRQRVQAEEVRGSLAAFQRDQFSQMRMMLQVESPLDMRDVAARARRLGLVPLAEQCMALAHARPLVRNELADRYEGHVESLTDDATHDARLTAFEATRRIHRAFITMENLCSRLHVRVHQLELARLAHSHSLGRRPRRLVRRQRRKVIAHRKDQRKIQGFVDDLLAREEGNGSSERALRS